MNTSTAHHLTDKLRNVRSHDLCQWCGGAKIRRQYRCGIESMSMYKRRRFCSPKCGRAHRSSLRLPDRKERRKAWVEAHGPCQHCGSYKRLEVDHIDPSKKKFDASDCWDSMQPERLAELEKCQVLCQKCHQKKTIRESWPARKHGTRVMYDKGRCRCQSCRDANARNHFDYMRRKHATEAIA